jgi:hypothetical protein
MKRRNFLAAAAASTTAAVAGCLGTGPADDEPADNATEDPTDEPTASPEPTSHGPELVDDSFEVTGVECGTEYGDHDVTTEDGRVTVEGTLDGRNTCYTAELVRGEYDDAEDTLYVEVEAVEDDDAAACNQCIVEIHYVATFEFEGGEPGTVRVEQRGETTGSSSASNSVSAGGDDSEEGTDTETPQSADD